MHDSIWIRMFLAVHIAAGAGAFLFAPIALATAKGGKQHKRWGRVYLWCMGVVAATALPMAIYRPVLFLALVAVFSFYMAFAGYRVLKLKDLARGGRAKPIDWIAAVITVADGALLLLLGALRPASIQVNGIVAVLFGLVGLMYGLGNIITFVRKPTERMFWLFNHFQGFLGSYIAAWSAFSVVTLSPLLGNQWYIWLWPTMVGVPGIALTAHYYKRKFTAQITPASVQA